MLQQTFVVRRTILTLLQPSTTIFSSTRGFIGRCLDAPAPARTLAVAPSKSTPVEEPLAVRLSMPAAAPLPMLPSSPTLLLDPAFSPTLTFLTSPLPPSSLLSAAEEAAGAGAPSGFVSPATTWAPGVPLLLLPEEVEMLLAPVALLVFSADVGDFWALFLAR